MEVDQEISNFYINVFVSRGFLRNFSILWKNVMKILREWSHFFKLHDLILVYTD